MSSQSYGEEWVIDFSDDVQKSQSREYDIIFHFINGLVSFSTNISTSVSLNDVPALIELSSDKKWYESNLQNI